MWGTRITQYMWGLGDILRKHGWIVLILYCLTEALSYLSIGHLIRAVPRCIRQFRFAFDLHNDKVKPGWQDAVAIGLLLLTPAAIDLASSHHPNEAFWGRLLASYLIADALLYHVRVLWFDDLKPRISPVRAQVWSHRRLLFVALAHYAQSIFLFGAVFLTIPQLQPIMLARALTRSFSNATLLSFPHTPTPTDIIQVSVSLFFIAISIATMASVAYRRQETE